MVELRTWLEGVPPNVLHKDPHLSFWWAWALGRSGRWAEGNVALRAAEESWTLESDRQGYGLIMFWHSTRAMHARDGNLALEYGKRALDALEDQLSPEYLMQLIVMGIAHLSNGHPARAEELYARARMRLDSTGLDWLRSTEKLESAQTLLQQGKLHEAELLGKQAVQDVAVRPTSTWMQGGLAVLGEIYLEWNRIDEAIRCFRQADELAEMTQALAWRSRIRLGRARLAWAQGDAELAHDELDPARAYAVLHQHEQDVRDAKAYQARFWIWSNQIVACATVGRKQ